MSRYQKDENLSGANKKDKVSPGEVVKYILLGLCLIPEIVLIVVFLFYSIYLIGSGRDFSINDKAIAVAGVVASALFAAISIGGLIRVKKHRFLVIASGFLMKICVFCLFLSVVVMDSDGPHTAPIAFAVIGIITGVLVGFISNCYDYEVRNGYGQMYGALSAPVMMPQFYGFDAEDRRKQATEEYMHVNYKNHGELTRQEKEQIYAYAAGDIIYFTTWLIRRGYLNEQVFEDAGEALSLIQSGFEDPTEFVKNQMHYVLSKEMVKDSVHFFLDMYLSEPVDLNYIYSAEDRDKYMFDYYRVVVPKTGNGIPLRFVHSFSWETYLQLEKVIDKRYDDAVNFITEGRNNVAVEKCTINSNVFNKEMKFYGDRGLTPEYVEKCAASLDTDALKIKDELAHIIYNRFLAVEFPDVVSSYPNEDEIFNLINAGRVDVPMPEDSSVVAYCVSGRVDINDPKKMLIISWAIRDGMLLNVIPLFRYQSPWDFENDNLYKRRIGFNRLEGCDVSTSEAAEALCAQGLLKRCPLVPAAFIDQSEDSFLYLPPEVCEVKAFYDSLVETLLVEELAESYRCKPYYGQNSVIPTRILIEGIGSNQRLIFSDDIQIQ